EILIRGFFQEYALAMDIGKEFPCRFIVDLTGSSGIDVEGYAEVLKSLLHEGMILVDERLWRDALLSSPDSDGHTILIGASHIDDILPLKPQVANISVGRQVRPRYMPDMQRAVGI